MIMLMFNSLSFFLLFILLEKGCVYVFLFELGFHCLYDNLKCEVGNVGLWIIEELKKACISTWMFAEIYVSNLFDLFS